MVIFFGVGCCSQLAHQGGTAEGYERCLAIAVNVALYGTTVVCGSNQPPWHGDNRMAWVSLGDPTGRWRKPPWWTGAAGAAVEHWGSSTDFCDYVNEIC